MTLKRNLYGLNESDLSQLFAKWDLPKFRAKQVFSWLYKHAAESFEAMTNLPKDLRATLDQHFEIKRLKPAQRFESQDGSVKFVFTLDDGHAIEAVYMVMKKGFTFCLSSQVGCAQACSFCQTAQMGFIRNLRTDEILGQAEQIVSTMGVDGPFNIVMMGMGEPLLNLPNLRKSMDIFFHPEGFNLSPKRMTVSTSGHVRNLQELGRYPRLPRIAISLNATTDSQRDELMPVNLKWPIETLLEACRHLPIAARDRITFEYVMLKGVNDTKEDAKRLVKLLQGIRCKVNLIPFNETATLPYQQPDDQNIALFHEILKKAGVLNTVRWSKGRDVGAACGQLATPIAKPGAKIAHSV